MALEIRDGPVVDLGAYARVSAAYEVASRMRVVAGRLVAEPVETPWVKDYDTQGDGGPEAWPRRFDVSRWRLLVAREGGRRVGGAVVAWDTDGVHLLGGRKDVAVLWDLRVDPAHRRQGVAGRLLDRGAAWARERGCVRLDVETQDVNVPACRFYASRGCILRRVDADAYPSLPDETLLLWSLALDGVSPGCTRRPGGRR